MFPLERCGIHFGQGSRHSKHERVMDFGAGYELLHVLLERVAGPKTVAVGEQPPHDRLPCSPSENRQHQQRG